MTSHRWGHAVPLETGETPLRCERCGCLSHWPMAKLQCGHWTPNGLEQKERQRAAANRRWGQVARSESLPEQQRKAAELRRSGLDYQSIADRLGTYAQLARQWARAGGAR